ncbi:MULTISPECIES: ABC transporter permease [Thermomonospora]|uniref:Inner-membrane translocator n=1 Tax=Thermomonospora curvata (strain ATCC 19995 / DSM 43183 / JCM 3096 / KCTC 9072 / NBRC 15933 / NCIMB 10081 / Henssen B9) TaxID=471852 RepID=D1A267_THECD|nr:MULTISPECIES: ABC transporter permease [Thermomonospora]ACY99720.1 inner-membrane translocator [Thermomonospora curvata DSM 43183]PKK12733.1 MAG: ABC transporter permease [Thermomonospora sp. CIF 1]
MSEQTAPSEADQTVRQTPEKERTPQSGRLRRLAAHVAAGPPWVVTVLAIALALLVGAVLIIVSDSEVTTAFGYFFARPSDALTASWTAVSTAYGALLKGAIFNPGNAGSATAALTPISETLTEATPLIFGGLAVGLAFRAGLFNIGGQGQLIIGAIATTWVGFTLDAPAVIALPAAVLAGIAGGALYGGLAGWLKAGPGAHEVIVTIMLNYVAYLLLGYLISSEVFRDPDNPQPVSKPVAEAARLPHLLGDSLRVNAGLLLAIAAVVFTWWLLNRSTLGFQLRTVGANPHAARTAGMSVGYGQIMAMVISGGLMGLVGVSQVLGTANAHNALTQQIDAGLGFTAITVALLGRASPLGTVAAALLFGALQAGGREMQAAAGVSIEIVTVIQALIVLFVAAPPLVRGLFRLRGDGGAGTGLLAKGWNG